MVVLIHAQEDVTESEKPERGSFHLVSGALWMRDLLEQSPLPFSWAGGAGQLTEVP